MADHEHYDGEMDSTEIWCQMPNAVSFFCHFFCHFFSRGRRGEKSRGWTRGAGGSCLSLALVAGLVDEDDAIDDGAGTGATAGAWVVWLASVVSFTLGILCLNCEVRCERHMTAVGLHSFDIF